MLPLNLLSLLKALFKPFWVKGSLHPLPVVSLLLLLVIKPNFSAPDRDLSQTYAYPVPFKPSEGHRAITFSLLPEQGSIRIYTAAGELVRKIEFESPMDGKLDWDVTDDGGQSVGSDVLVYVVKSGDSVKTGKILVIR